MFARKLYDDAVLGAAQGVFRLRTSLFREVHTYQWRKGSAGAGTILVYASAADLADLEELDPAVNTNWQLDAGLEFSPKDMTDGVPSGSRVLRLCGSPFRALLFEVTITETILSFDLHARHGGKWL